MTLREKYERSLKDSENYINGEKVNVTSSYKNGKVLAKFFNEELDYSDINVHYSYPVERFGKTEDWDLKIRFQLRKTEINRYSPLNAAFVYQYLSVLADSEWVKGEPTDSIAKEICRGMKDNLAPVQPDLNIKSISVEWAIHVPDCTTVFVNLLYAYPSEEELEKRMMEEEAAQNQEEQ
ncbi:MAG TPA: hypothetical protein DEO40_00375 [Treponema sp.]|jgi:hypothetical protein|nr:hypothetical protein [Treponema sp.]HCA19115.1 hypothetical protein [Treponema sp.]